MLLGSVPDMPFLVDEDAGESPSPLRKPDDKVDGLQGLPVRSWIRLLLQVAFPDSLLDGKGAGLVVMEPCKQRVTDPRA
jgi:hypothetical protein